MSGYEDEMRERMHASLQEKVEVLRARDRLMEQLEMVHSDIVFGQIGRAQELLEEMLDTYWAENSAVAATVRRVIRR